MKIFCTANLSLLVSLRSLIICRRRMPRKVSFSFPSWQHFLCRANCGKCPLFLVPLWCRTWLFKQNGTLYTTSAVQVHYFLCCFLLVIIPRFYITKGKGWSCSGFIIFLMVKEFLNQVKFARCFGSNCVKTDAAALSFTFRRKNREQTPVEVALKLF